MRIVFLAELTGKTDPMYALIHCGALELMFVIIVFLLPVLGFPRQHGNREEKVRAVRKWWNWQTHHLEGVAP